MEINFACYVEKENLIECPRGSEAIERLEHAEGNKLASRRTHRMTF